MSQTHLIKGSLLFDKTTQRYYRTVKVVKACNLIYFVTFDKDLQEVILPDRFMLDRIVERIEAGSLCFVSNDLFLPRLKTVDSMTPAEAKTFHRGWNKIKDHVDNDILLTPKGRFEFIAELANSEKRASSVSVLNWLKKYFVGGMNSLALAPNFYKCGAPGVDRIYKRKTSQARIDLIVKGYNSFAKKGKTIEACRELTNAKFHDPKVHGSAKLRDGEFRRYVKKYFPNDFQGKEWKYGEGYSKSNFRLLKGKSADIANGPGCLFQIDWTSTDIEVVSSINRQFRIGKPKLYLVVDTYSRLIVGFHLTLKNPSYKTFCRALYNTAMCKVKFAARYGLSITPEQWNSAVLPQAIVTDGGPDVANIKIEALSQPPLEIGSAITAAYRGELKAIVERINGSIKTAVKVFLEGYGLNQERYKRRPGVDTRDEATVTMRELYHIIINLVIEHNHSTIDKFQPTDRMLKNNVQPIPSMIWNDGIEHGDGVQKHVTDLQALMLNLQTPEVRVPSRKGFEINKYHYTPINDEDRFLLENLINGPSGAGEQGIVYDPDFYESKYWYYQTRFIPLRRLGEDDPEFQSEDEVIETNNFYNAEAPENEDKQNDLAVQTLSSNLDILNEAMKKTREASSGAKKKSFEGTLKSFEPDNHNHLGEHADKNAKKTTNDVKNEPDISVLYYSQLLENINSN